MFTSIRFSIDNYLSERLIMKFRKYELTKLCMEEHLNTLKAEVDTLRAAITYKVSKEELQTTFVHLNIIRKYNAKRYKKRLNEYNRLAKAHARISKIAKKISDKIGS